VFDAIGPGQWALAGVIHGPPGADTIPCTYDLIVRK